MRLLKLYVAASLDGYIATADGSVEWLDSYQSDEEDYGYHRFYDSVDTLLMGGNTYRAILGFGCDWPYAGKQTWVLSRSIQAADSGQVGIISRDALTFVRQLKSLETGKDIWLVGSGEIISLLLAENLIDEMQLCMWPDMILAFRPIHTSLPMTVSPRRGSSCILDATGRVLTGHQGPRFAGIIGDLRHNRCAVENMHLF